MTAAEAPSAEVRARWRAVSLAFAVAFVAAGVGLQAEIPLNRDIAYLVYADIRLLAGDAVFGSDAPVNYTLLLASNHFLYLIPALLIHLLGAPTAVAIKAYVVAIAGLALGYVARFAGSQVRPAAWLLVPGAAFFSMIFPVDGFGQRDHLFFMLLLPYVLHVLRRDHAGPASWPIAAMTAVAVAIKPYFVVAWALLAVFEAYQARSWRPLLGRVAIAVVAVNAAYYGWAIGFAALSDGGLGGLLDSVALKRGDYTQGYADILVRRLSLLWLLALASFAVVAGAARRAGGAFFVAFAGCFAVALLQATGVDYQWYPATLFAGGLVLWNAVASVAGTRRRMAWLLALAFAGALLVRTEAYARREIGRENAVAHMTERLVRHARGEPVFIITWDHFPFYPALVRTSLIAASRYQIYSFLDAWVANAEAGGGAHAATFLDAVIGGVVEDFARHRPRLVILPKAEPGALALLLGDARVARLMADFEQVDESHGFKLLVRRPEP